MVLILSIGLLLHMQTGNTNKRKRVVVFHHLKANIDNQICRSIDFLFCQLSGTMFGHQVGVCHHVGAAIVVVWHCMGV